MEVGLVGNHLGAAPNRAVRELNTNIARVIIRLVGQVASTAWDVLRSMLHVMYTTVLCMEDLLSGICSVLVPPVVGKE